LKRQVASLQVQLDITHEALAVKDAELEILRSDLRRLARVTNRRSSGKAAEQQVQQLRAQLAAQETHCNRLAVEAEQLGEQLAMVRGDLASADDEKCMLRSLVAEKDAAMKELNHRVSELQARTTALLEQLVAVRRQQAKHQADALPLLSPVAKRNCRSWLSDDESEMSTSRSSMTAGMGQRHVSGVGAARETVYRMRTTGGQRIVGKVVGTMLAVRTAVALAVMLERAVLGRCS
jgi:hypothetical protein